MKKIVHIFLFILLLNACTSHKEKGLTLTLINGSLPKMANQWLYIQELDVKKINPLDSVLIEKEGSFEISIDVSEPGFYILKTHNDNYALLFVEPNNPITINTASDLFQEGYEVPGAVDSELLRDFEQFMKLQKQKVDSLANELNKSRGLENFYEKKMALDSAYFEIYSLQRDYVIEFLETVNWEIIKCWMKRKTLSTVINWIGR